MPELPEVDLVTRHLSKLVLRKRIISARLLRPKLSPFATAEEFAVRLAESRITDINRRGKHILIGLDNGMTLITHLRMSGRFVMLPAEMPEPKFSHAQFSLDNENVLHFADQRHFGMMKIVETASLFESKELACLAPEPFTDEFSPEYLYRTLKRSKRNIKEMLLDQTKVCGLGNIYAAEALFLAKIRPTLRADRISAKRSLALHGAIREVLASAIAVSETVPVFPENIGGNFYGENADGDWSVYGRESKPCVICEEPIVRIAQGGRSTFFCRKCQSR